MTDYTEAAESKRGLLRALEELEKNAAYKKLTEDLQAIIDHAQNAIIMKPVRSQDEVLAQEFEKGKIVGILAFGASVQQLRETLEFELQQLKSEQEDFENED